MWRHWRRDSEAVGFHARTWKKFSPLPLRSFGVLPATPDRRTLPDAIRGYCTARRDNGVIVG